MGPGNSIPVGSPFRTACAGAALRCLLTRRPTRRGASLSTRAQTTPSVTRRSSARPARSPGPSRLRPRAGGIRAPSRSTKGSGGGRSGWCCR
eukprot:10548304-Alexandrium_andersonii.AAC.1